MSGRTSAVPHLLAVTLILYACHESKREVVSSAIVIPPGDSTPPTLVLEAFMPDGERIEVVDPQAEPTERKVRDGETIEFRAIGEDSDGGVKSVILVSDLRVLCAKGDQGAASLAFVRDRAESSDPSSIAGGQGLTARVASLTVMIDTKVLKAQCNPGLDLKKVIGKVGAQVENFYDGSITIESFGIEYP
jgi:hypothetical protein